MYRYGVVFILAAVLSFIFTPMAKKLAYRLGAIDVPKDDRRIHKEPTPRIGGLAIYLAFSIVTLIFSRFNRNVLGIIIGGTILVIMGIFDDIKPLRPVQKLIFQILAAIVLIMFNINVECITVPFMPGGEGFDTGYAGFLITIIWVVGITNAINLIDGVDGLACGICLIAALTLFGVSIISQRYMAIFLTAVLAGSCLGFLPYNFNPASIFMGDTGSQFLGFALAAISIQGAIKSAAAVAVAVPILALGLPIYDTLFAMVRRKVNKRPIMEADRGHLHHRLLDMGLSQKKVVLVMYTISAFLGATSIIAMRVSTNKSFELLILVFLITIALAIEFGFFKKSNKNE